MAPSGAPLDYLHASCPALVANLWDVTDGDCDKLTTALLDRAAAGGSLLAAVAHARAACRLRYLTGAAAVCYGLPVATLPRGDAADHGASPASLPRTRAAQLEQGTSRVDSGGPVARFRE